MKLLSLRYWEVLGSPDVDTILFEDSLLFCIDPGGNYPGLAL
jgi:hypothetical protein